MPRGNQGLIVTGPGGYSFAEAGGCEVDAEVFLGTVVKGRDLLAAGRAPAALLEFRCAIGVWAGEPLAEDAYEDWAQEYRTTLVRARLDALEGAAAAALDTGDAAEAVSFSELAVMQEPLREAAHLLLVKALAASGDPAAALAAFERLRQCLDDELGLDPSAEANELQLRILRGEQVVTTVAAPAAQGRRAFAELPFLGRDDELEAMLARLAEAFPAPILVAGPPGAGKSRLLAETGARSRRPILAAQGFRTQQEESWGLARALLGEVLALDASVVAALSERAAQALADIVPELADLRRLGSDIVDPESRRALAREGATRLFEAVAGKAPLIVVDDLQWVDATSLALLERVASRAPRIGLLIAYRSGEVPSEGPAASFLAGMSEVAGDALRITLGALPHGAVTELVGDSGLAEVMLRETEGTPFAIGEVLRTLIDRGVLEADRRGRWEVRRAVDGEVRAAARVGKRKAIEGRVRRQSPREAELLSLLALLGREAPARLLAGALRSDDQTAVLDDLESLAGAGLVRLGERGWSTHHDVIGEVVVQGLEPSRKGRLHASLAAALQRDGAEPAEIALHLVGAGDPDGAADAFATAARRGLERFANNEAEELSTAGLGLGPRADLRTVLLEVRAEAKARRGDTLTARDDLRTALETGCADRARILTSMAMLTSVADDYVVASELIEMALGEAGEDPLGRARALAAGARMDLNLQRLDRAESRAAEALDLFERTGDPNGVADVLETRSMIAVHVGRYLEAMELLGRTDRLLQDAGRLMRVGRARSNWAVGLALTGRPEEALQVLDEALDLERVLGHPEGEAYCQWYRCEVLVNLGRVQEGKEAAEEALRVARRIGHREWSAGALKGLGEACKAAGDLEGAENAFTGCLELSAQMPIFRSWALAGIASVRVARGDFSGARRYVAEALTVGTPMTQYSAHAVAAQLAVASGDPDADSIVNEALARAERAGDAYHAAQIRELAARTERN